jgi:hypothetical protein
VFRDEAGQNEMGVGMLSAMLGILSGMAEKRQARGADRMFFPSIGILLASLQRHCNLVPDIRLVSAVKIHDAEYLKPGTRKP